MRGRLWIGIFFIVFGVGFFMQQAEILDFASVLRIWWPLIFVIIGIIQIINRTHSSLITGLIFIVIGSLFLINQFVDINLYAFIWPLIFIAVGFVFVFAREDREKPSHTAQDLQTFALFSGADIRSQSTNFKGGNVTTVFGGAEIDLREIKLSAEGATIDLTTVFGGISILAPENVEVEITGLPIFGGWENKTRKIGTEESNPKLILKCIAVFGGVEVKN